MTGREEACIRLAKLVDVSGKKVLDIGCSIGWFPKIATERLGVKRLDAIEPDEEKVAQAVKNAWKAKIKQGVAEKLEFKANSFDVVTMFDVIEHVPSGKEKKVFDEIARVLKKGGKLALSTPYDYWFSRLTDPAWYFGHRHYSVGELSKMIERAGMKVTYSRVHGGIWEIIAMWVLYISKWIFRAKMPLEEWFDKRRSREFKRDGYVILFLTAVKE